MPLFDERDHQLAYHDFALVYDEMMQGIDYPSWVDYVLKLYEKYAPPEMAGTAILDLACGTGSFLALLQEKGWQVTGVDRSPSMLALADEKLRAGKGPYRLLEQDLRRVEVGEKFPLITCLCDSLNYLLSPHHLREALERVYEHLLPGGVFIADLNSPFKFREILGDNTYTAVFENSAYIWVNFFDPASGRCRMELDFFQRYQGELFRHFKEVHWQQLYQPEEIEELATKVGFSFVESFGAFTFQPATPTDERIFYLLSR
ncbi:MAG: class I SAM-dependent methyltransferase [Firmicutes bacterium]|nr:class I SAM-dependent methyltransferase [Bacillota bacterium]